MSDDAKKLGTALLFFVAHYREGADLAFAYEIAVAALTEAGVDTEAEGAVQP